MKIAFLGGGNMAAAIIGGLLRAGQTQDMAVYVADRNPDRQRYFDGLGVAAGETLPVLTAQDVLVLAVKPQDMQAACTAADSGGALVLSLAAGLETAVLSRWLGGTQRIIRAMPNTPAQVGLGMAGLYADAAVSTADRTLAARIIGASGAVLWLEQEAQLHALTAVSGSGPAYVFYLLGALQQAAVRLGFSEEQARQLSLATFEGAVALAAQSEHDFQTLQQQVTSKGGTTSAALEVFRQQQLAEHFQAAVSAAAARSTELAAMLGKPE